MFASAARASASVLVLGLLWAGPVTAQTACPYIIDQTKPTQPQWNFCFTSKQNIVPYPMVSPSGSLVAGKITVVPSTALSAGFNVQPGVAPTVPVNGDIWSTGTGVYLYAGGSTVGPFPVVAGGPYVLRFGVNMTGELTTLASGSAGAGFNVQPGVSPTSPNNGDVWVTASGFFYDAAGVAVQPFQTAGGTMQGKLGTLASGTAGAGFNLPHGAAPTAPVNGDIWTTTVGTYVQINGATVGPIGIPAGCTMGCAFFSGSTLTGKLNTAQPNGPFLVPGRCNILYECAGFNIALGVAPAAPNNGDIWATNQGLYAQINGGTVGPYMGLNGRPVTAKFATVASTTGSTGFNLNASSNITPTSPINGDLWATSGGLYTRANATTSGPLTGMRQYSVSGTQQYGQHIVQGSATILSGSGQTATVSLTGSAVFTSAASYECVLTVNNALRDSSLQQISGSVFAIYSDNNGPNIYYMCVGS